jgi:hypothetical protein
MKFTSLTHPCIGEPFGPRTAQMLMKIAKDKRIANHGSLLPPSWRTLYDLTRLTVEQFDHLLEAGIIRPDLERHEISKFRRLAKVAEDEERVLKLKPVAGKFKFHIWLLYDASSSGSPSPRKH